MTTMRKDAVALIQELPEEQLTELPGIMRATSRNVQPKREALEAGRKAFERLESLRRPIPGLDEKKELTECREEKFGYASAD